MEKSVIILSCFNKNNKKNITFILIEDVMYICYKVKTYVILVILFFLDYKLQKNLIINRTSKALEWETSCEFITSFYNPLEHRLGKDMPILRYPLCSVDTQLKW